MKKNNIIICLLILIFSCTHVLARSKVIIDRHKQCSEGNLLICLEVNRDSSQGRRCRENNEAMACSELGHAHLNAYKGKGDSPRDPETRKKDQQRILYFLQRACDLRFFDACLTLAKEYEKGNIVEKNIEQSNDIYQNLCSVEKIGDGCFHQARLMAEEKIQGDFPHVKDLLTQACQFDFPLACFEIGNLLNKDSSLKDGEKQALEFWEKGCQEKDGKSCHALASFFETQQNFEKAHFLYQKSCFFEDFKACAKFIHFHQKHPFPAFSLEIQRETYEGNEKYQRIDLSKERFAKDFHLELFLKTQEACFHGNSRGCADFRIHDTTKNTSLFHRSDKYLTYILFPIKIGCMMGNLDSCIEWAKAFGFETGVAILQNSEFQEGLLKTLCQEDHFKACHELALIYQIYSNSKELKVNHSQRLLQWACQGGYGPSCTELLRKKEEKLSHYKNISALKEACSMQSIEACITLTRIDQLNEQVNLLIQKCEKNDPFACFEGAFILFEFEQIERRNSHMLVLFEKACQLGNKEACTIQKVIDPETLTLTREGYDLLDQTCYKPSFWEKIFGGYSSKDFSGCGFSSYIAYAFFSHGENASKDAKRGCERGYPFACEMYTKSLLAGFGKNLSLEDIEQTEKECKKTTSGICHGIVVNYVELSFKNKDPNLQKKALQIAEKSCNMGHVLSCFKAGELYLYPHLEKRFPDNAHFRHEGFPPPDFEKAKSFFIKACNQGFFDSCEALFSIYIKENDYHAENFSFEPWLMNELCKNGNKIICHNIVKKEKE